MRTWVIKMVNLSFTFCHQKPVRIPVLYHACHMPRLSQPLRFHDSNNILHDDKPTDRRLFALLQ
jgi:hypothetical protein